MEGGKRNSIATSQLAFGKIFNVNWSSEGRARLYILRTYPPSRCSPGTQPGSRVYPKPGHAMVGGGPEGC